MERRQLDKKGGMMEKRRIRKPREVELGIGISFLEALKLRDKFLEQSAENTCSKMTLVPEISNRQWDVACSQFSGYLPLYGCSNFFTCLLSIFFIKQCYNVFDFRKYKFFKMDGNEEQVIYALEFIPHGSSPPTKLSHNSIWKILIMGNK